MKSTIYKLLTGPASGAHLLLREPRTNETITPGEDGTWSHPDFRWTLIPDEMEIGQFFNDAGYELQAVMRNQPKDPVEQGCRGWVPPKAIKGWFLIMIQDTEEGAQAVYARALSSKRVNGQVEKAGQAQ